MKEVTRKKVLPAAIVGLVVFLVIKIDLNLQCLTESYSHHFPKNKQTKIKVSSLTKVLLPIRSHLIKITLVQSLNK